MIDWIQQCSGAFRTAAWNPFGVAQRVLQWTRLIDVWGREFERLDCADRIIRSLYFHGRFLYRRQEYELLGNHLIKTAAGLLSAARFFQGREAATWERQAKRILLDQVREQVLSDGGHYERSPMYHLLVLQDLADALNISDDADTVWRRRISDAVQRMLDFGEECADPSGRILLTNDSVWGQTPARLDLLAYAGALVEKAVRGNNRPPCRTNRFPDFGMYRMSDGQWTLWLDGGPPGPGFLMAHAHADAGSVLAWLRELPVLIDTGVFCYGGDMDRRMYDRSGRAHNVLVLDGQGDCDCWGTFRVGRRARQIKAEVDERCRTAEIRHDGFAHMRGRPQYVRTVCLLDGALEVQDRVLWTGNHEHTAEVCWHFHPDVCVASERGNGSRLRACVENATLQVDIQSADGVIIEERPVAFRFHESQPAPVVRAVVTGRREIRLTTRITELGSKHLRKSHAS